MKKIAASAAVVIVNIVIMQVFRFYGESLFPYYRDISKKWIKLLSFLTSFSRIAVWDILLAVIILFLLAGLIRIVIRREGLLKWISGVCILAAVIFTEVNCGWMLNHYAPSLNDEISLEVRKYSVDELYEASEWYLNQAMEYAVMMKRDDENHLAAQNFYDTAEQAGKIYQELSKEYDIFNGSSVRVKKLSLIGEYLMYNGIIGMFMPVTGEAGVPGSVPDAVLPFTMAHEAGHRLGLADEEEANCAAFLACMSSDDLYFLYSGYYQAYGYCINALYKADPERYYELAGRYSEDEKYQVLRTDRIDTSEVYKRYESPLKEVSDKINDTYLKAYSEKDGVQSYGKVADELIAWYMKYMKSSS